MKKLLLLTTLIFIVIFNTCWGLSIKTAKAATTIQVGESRITLNDSDQLNPDIYQYGLNHFAVVWQDNRNGNWDIYMYYQKYLGDSLWDVRWDAQITQSAGNNTNPKIFNDTIVYQSDRNGNWDIYIYNLTSKVETQITNNIAIQSNPAIYGETIVWQDARNAAWNSNYNDYYPWSIYMYNLTTHFQQQISPQNQDTLNPAISGNRVIYIKKLFTFIKGSGLYADRYVFSPYVCSYNLSTGIEIDVHIVSNFLVPLYIPNYINSPAIDENRIVWTMREPAKSGWNIEMIDLSTGANWKSALGSYERPDICKNYIVYQGNDNGNWDIYLYDFNSNSLHKVTNNSANQQNPTISATQYSNFIVYQDDRNGNLDIYLSAFWFNVMGGGSTPHLPITPSSIIEELQETKNRIADIPSMDFAGKKDKIKENRKNTMLHQFNATVKTIEAAAKTQNLKLQTKYFQSAIDQLNGLINKLDGWTAGRGADMPGSGYTPDWILAPQYYDQVIRSCRNDLQTILNGMT